jgi:hypothetical protein
MQDRWCEACQTSQTARDIEIAYDWRDSRRAQHRCAFGPARERNDARARNACKQHPRGAQADVAASDDEHALAPQKSCGDHDRAIVAAVVNARRRGAWRAPRAERCAMRQIGALEGRLHRRRTSRWRRQRFLFFRFERYGI